MNGQEGRIAPGSPRMATGRDAIRPGAATMAASTASPVPYAVAAGCAVAALALGAALAVTAHRDPEQAVVVDVELEAPAAEQPQAVYVAPDLVGMELKDAAGELFRAGLTMGEVSNVQSDAVAPGRVVSQRPAAWWSGTETFAVDVAVCNGPYTVEVPVVSGLPEADAVAALAAAGFTARHDSTMDARSESVATGDVLVSDGDGHRMSKGSEVAYGLSLGPEGMVAEAQAAPRAVPEVPQAGVGAASPVPAPAYVEVGEPSQAAPFVPVTVGEEAQQTGLAFSATEEP